MSATLAMQKTRGQRSPFPCCRDHWVVPVEDENLETCISPASAGPLFALGLMSQFEFCRGPWKITGFRYLKPVLAVCNPNPILQSGVLDSMGAISRLCHFAQRCDSDGLPPLGYASGEDHGIGRTRTRVPIRRHLMCWSST